MGGIGARLGVDEAVVARSPLLQVSRLGNPDDLLTAAFEIAPQDPDLGGALLAAAALAQAERTSEGRLAASLSLLAKLLAKADPKKTLGPDGAALRAELIPNGWRYTLGSWPRLRYAWRGGLQKLLAPKEHLGALDAASVPDTAPVVDALDEVTRLTPAEPEPVSVAIQGSFPAPGVAFAVASAGLLVSGWSLYREMRMERRMRRVR